MKQPIEKDGRLLCPECGEKTICNRCGHKVKREKDQNIGYPWYCHGCDENMFDFEVTTVGEELSGDGENHLECINCDYVCHEADIK